MDATVVVLGLVCLSLVVLIAWREHENSKERAALADRLQAPGAAAMAAMEQAIGPMSTEPPKDLYDEPVRPSDDLILDNLMMERT